MFLAASVRATTASGAQSLVLHVASIEQQQGDLRAAAALPAGIGYHASVTAARDALRALQPLPPGGATVLLHEGTHRPFELAGEIDSGRPGAPIVYAAAPGERAVVSGAVTIPASAFKPWPDRKGVVAADLAALGITADDLGSMQYPTSEGNMNFGSCQHDKAELFFGGDAMTLARYPNLAADGSWRFLYADRAAEFGPGSPGGPTQGGGAWWLMKTGANATKIQTWATEDKASSWLHGAPVFFLQWLRMLIPCAYATGYWEFDWADSYRKLSTATLVKLNNTDYLNVSFIPGEPPNSNSAFVCNPVPASHVWFVTCPDTGIESAGLQVVKKNARFYGVNLLSELDAPNEHVLCTKMIAIVLHVTLLCC